MTDKDHIIKALEELIHICRDGQQGYRDGAEHAKKPELKKLLSEVSLERAKFAGDLESEAVRWGKPDVDRTGDTLGAIHRGWTDLKVSLGGGDDAILSSMQTGDDYAKQHYDKYVTDKNLPDEVRGVLRNQAQAIVGTLDRVRAMRGSKAA